jgi:hypothetical protein
MDVVVMPALCCESTERLVIMNAQPLHAIFWLESTRAMLYRPPNDPDGGVRGHLLAN